MKEAVATHMQDDSRNNACFVFSVSESEGLFVRYLRATLGREVRASSLAASIAMILFILFITYVVFVSPGKIPDMMQAWNRIRYYAVAPFIVLALLLFVRGFFLFTLDSGWAWNSKYLGQKFIKGGKKYGTMSKKVWIRSAERNHSKNAYYFDERLGCENRIPVNAELYPNRIAIKQDGRKKDIVFSLSDTYKEFWGAGLVALRFKTKDGPRDIVLSVEEWSKEEIARLNSFFVEALPLWCRRYTRRPGAPLGRKRFAFVRHPVYDRWDYRIPLLHSKKSIVSFITPSELLEGSFEEKRKK